MSEPFTYSRNSPEEIEAFVKAEWGKHEVGFALLENVQVQISYLERVLEETELDEFDDEELRTAYQRHLIKLLGLARRWHHRLQTSGQTRAATGGGESEAEGQNQIEKIEFNGTVSQFVFFHELLFQMENGLSLKQYDRRWALLSKHFTVRGKTVTANTLKSTASNMLNTKNKKPRGHEGFLALVQLLEKIPEEMEAFLSENQNH